MGDEDDRRTKFGSQDGPDTDHDGVDDWTEMVIGTDPKQPNEWGEIYERLADSDRDGLSDYAERQIGTNPFARDTDHDGLDDVFEIQHGLDPKDNLDDPPEPAPKVPMRLPEEHRTPSTEITHVRDDAKVQDFLRNVLAQVGDKYQRGAEASLSDDDPDRWDGSELVEWSANRAGVMINDGAANQYKQLAQHGGELSVEQALHTPGALLYEFTGDPLHGHPTRASTAISLGDGRIVDIDPVAGVRIVDAADFHFTHAGVMPGFTDAFDPGDSARDVVHDALVQHGIATPDPTGATQGSTTEDAAPGAGTTGDTATGSDAQPVPDTPAIADLADRAAHLRATLLERTGDDQLVDLVARSDDAGKREVLAEEAIQKTRTQVDSQRQQAADNRSTAQDLERQAQAAETAGDARAAEELRERAAHIEALAGANDRLAARYESEIAKYQQEHDVAAQERETLNGQYEQRTAQLSAAEQAIDALEDRVLYLREANAERARAEGLDREAAQFRAAGNELEANARALEAATAREAADAAQVRADVVFVDERALSPLETGGSALSEPLMAPDTADAQATGAADDAVVAHEDGADALVDDVLGVQTAGQAEPAPAGEDAAAGAFDAPGTAALTATEPPTVDAPTNVARPEDAGIVEHAAANVAFDDPTGTATADAGLPADGDTAATADEG